MTTVEKFVKKYEEYVKKGKKKEFEELVKKKIEELKAKGKEERARELEFMYKARRTLYEMYRSKRSVERVREKLAKAKRKK
jgi:hypothetical protein